MEDNNTLINSSRKLTNIQSDEPEVQVKEWLVTIYRTIGKIPSLSICMISQLSQLFHWTQTQAFLSIDMKI